MTATKTQPAKKASTPRKPATTKPAPAKTAPKPKASSVPKEKAEAIKARAAKANTRPVEPEARTLQEALTLGEAVLVKIRANGTVRSLPYLAPGSEVRETAMTVEERRAAGDTIEKIAEDMKVSVATVRRYVTGLALAHEVEDGKHDKAWTKGEKNVVVHTVVAKAAK